MIHPISTPIPEEYVEVYDKNGNKITDMINYHNAYKIIVKNTDEARKLSIKWYNNRGNAVPKPCTYAHGYLRMPTLPFRYTGTYIIDIDEHDTYSSIGWKIDSEKEE